MKNGGGDAPTIEELNITANGTYTASGDVDGYSPINVSVLPNIGTKTVTANGTYAASSDNLDGYSSVTVNVDTAFYPATSMGLTDITPIESDTMRVVPTAGTDYYPYVFLKAAPSGSTDKQPYGKRFDGQSEEYIVSVFLDLINVATGESAPNYPQQISPTQANFSIVSGGYVEIKNWTVSANASQVRITTERYNPTYTKPVENTYESASVTPSGALDDYLITPFKILSNQDNTHSG